MTNVSDGTDDLYGWLLLDAAASSREIAISPRVLRDSWSDARFPFAAVDARGVTALAKLAYAYGILSNPALRAEYDAESGLKEASIASRVRKRAHWGRYWAWGFVVLALIVAAFPEVVAFSAGSIFAPDFEFHHHNAVGVTGSDGEIYSACEGGGNVPSALHCSEITSSSPAWNRALHSWWRMSALPAGALLVVAFLGYEVVNWRAFHAIARVRGAGQLDTRPRLITLLVALGTPSALLIPVLAILFLTTGFLDLPDLDARG